MKEKMLAVRKEKKEKGVELKNINIPKHSDNEVLVKVKATSICGTDVHIYEWNDWAKNRMNPPLTIGHEFAGEIIELGKNIKGFEKGDLISAETHIACWTCFQCKTGNAHICENVKILGVDTNGVAAEYVALPARNIWKNDPSLPIETMSVQDPLGNAVHTLYSNDDTIAGSNILITGCGPIGLMAIALAKASGASTIFATETNPYRIKLAEKMGATKVINPLKDKVPDKLSEEIGKEKIDIICEMSGNENALKDALASLRPGGRVSLLGLFPSELKVDLNNIIFKSARVYGINGRKMFDTWYKVKEFLSSGAVNPMDIVTHKMKLSDYEKGMKIMQTGECGKVVFKL